MFLARTTGLTKRLFSTKRINPRFTIYGSDSCIQIVPIAPTSYNVEGSNYPKVKSGYLLFSWTKFIDGSYDWKNKESISLMPLDIGSLLNIIEGKSSEFSFSRKPYLGNERDGSEPAPAKSFLASMHENNNLLMQLTVGDESFMAAIDAGKARTLKTLLEYSIPYLFSFDSIAVQQETSEGQDNDNYSRSSDRNNGNSPNKKSDKWLF